MQSIKTNMLPKETHSLPLTEDYSSSLTLLNLLANDDSDSATEEVRSKSPLKSFRKRLKKVATSFRIKKDFKQPSSTHGILCQKSSARDSDLTSALSASASSLDSSRSCQRVRFSAYSEEHEIPCLDDYTSKEISSIWFTDSDYENIQDRFEKIVLKIEKGKKLKAKYCVRGLECMTTDGWDRKKTQVDAAVAAVLVEQEHQLESGEKNPELVAQLYSRETKFARQAARSLAVSDEEEVRAYASD